MKARQRWLAVVGCGWHDGDAMLGTLRSMPGAAVVADDELQSFVVRFDAASRRGAQQVLRRVMAYPSAQVSHYTRIAREDEL
jgi:hypothetical protein